MDAVEFVRNYRKMLKKRGFGLLINSDENTPEEIVAETEKWAAAHPVKTRQSVFLEQWPKCPMDDDGVVGTCPRNVEKNYICDLNRSAGCPDCRREFWMQEME